MSDVITLDAADLAIKKMFLDSVDVLIRTTHCNKEAAQESTFIMISRLMPYRKETLRKYLSQIGCYE